MNLNKYDSQGYPYTPEEAAERAVAIFGQRFVVKQPRKPHNVGRNAKKRAAKAAMANLLRGIRHV